MNMNECCDQLCEEAHWGGPWVDLPAPVLEPMVDGVLDPGLSFATVRIAPYAGMACGDRLVMFWVGLNDEGQRYLHEAEAFVSSGQVDKDVLFIVAAEHIDAIDGGSLEVFYSLDSASRVIPVDSERLCIDVGDVRRDLLPARVERTVGGALDPRRVNEGVRVTVRPYARMACGDKVSFSWKGATTVASFTDTLIIESYSVGSEISFWVDASYIVPNLGGEVSFSYVVEQMGLPARRSETGQVLIGALERQALPLARVLASDEGRLALMDAQDGISIVVDGGDIEAGEMVYLKCDGQFFSHRDEREVTESMVGKPMRFTVPLSFWEEHQGLRVGVSYVIGRLDDVSQASDVVYIEVDAQEEVAAE